MRMVFILFVDLTEVGKEMKFLTGYLGEGVNLLKVVWLQRGSETSPSPNPCPLHRGVWVGGGLGRAQELPQSPPLIFFSASTFHPY